MSSEPPQPPAAPETPAADEAPVQAPAAAEPVAVEPPVPVEPVAEPAFGAPSFPAQPLPAQPLPAQPFAAPPFGAPAGYGWPAAEAVDDRRPVRGSRTLLLLVAALLLGPLVGGGIGYAIQAQRPPTPLPPLQPVAQPQYPAGALSPQAAAAALPAPLSIDGDLRKLLLAKPADAQDEDGNASGATPGGWETVGEMARERGDSATEFEDLLDAGLRRTAMTGWRKGDIDYRIELIQYFSADARSAYEAMDQAHVRNPQSVPFADGMQGSYWADPKQRTYVQTNLKFYYGGAKTRRGDVLVSVEIYSPNPVNADEARDLAKQQWERLG
ncbi:hypothetical protein [Kitasatospora nipponensis]|uniref:hypothetical protein n=1 Tax=Kitasatospora nipponensis TaxID=258049 RepID=UPI0031D643AD